MPRLPLTLASLACLAALAAGASNTPTVSSSRAPSPPATPSSSPSWAPGLIITTAARMGYPTGVAVVADGVVYSTFTSIYKLMPTGAVILLAGSGDEDVGYSGDGGPATLALLSMPAGLAVDAIGAVLIADSNNHRVRMIWPNGTITLLAGAGTGAGLYTHGDGGPATRANLEYPSAIAVNSSGAVFIAEEGENSRGYCGVYIFRPRPFSVWGDRICIRRRTHL